MRGRPKLKNPRNKTVRIKCREEHEEELISFVYEKREELERQDKQYKEAEDAKMD